MKESVYASSEVVDSESVLVIRLLRAQSNAGNTGEVGMAQLSTAVHLQGCTSLVHDVTIGRN